MNDTLITEIAKKNDFFLFLFSKWEVIKKALICKIYYFQKQICRFLLDVFSFMRMHCGLYRDKTLDWTSSLFLQNELVEISDWMNRTPNYWTDGMMMALIHFYFWPHIILGCSKRTFIEQVFCMLRLFVERFTRIKSESLVCILKKEKSC